MPEQEANAPMPKEVSDALRRMEWRREIVTRFMWLLGLSSIAAGVGLKAGVDTALIVTGGLVWGEYFVGGLVELIVSQKGAK